MDSNNSSATVRETILIVEDSLTQAEQVKHILERQGYQTSRVRNGKEAIVWLRTHEPDLIISDINMPEMNGYDLCRRIRSDEKLQSLPVVLLTALADPEDVVRGLECGADNFITKPFEEQYLLARIRYMLSHRHLNQHEKTRFSLEVFFAGKNHVITADRLQILNHLLSTYETAVLKNQELEKARNQLQSLNEQLERRVQERTAALRAENEERKRAEEKYRSIFDNVVEGIFQTTPDGRLLAANPALARIYGFESPQQLMAAVSNIGNQAYVDPARRAEFRAILEKENAVIGFESEVYRKDRGIIWISVNARTVRDETGKILYYEGTTMDVTESKRAELKFRTLLESAPDAMVIVNRNGKIALVNSQTEKLFGYPREELLDQPVELLLPEDLRGRHHTRRAAFSERPQARLMGRELDLRARRKNGTEFPIEVSLSPLETEEGTLVISAIRDLTEQKRVEAQSLRAQRLESIGTLAGGIAHDLNNVLAPVLMSIDILRLKYPDKKAERIIASIESSARRGAEMVKQILTFARGVEGERITIDLRNLINEIAKILKQTFPKIIEIRTALDDGLWLVTADATQVHQVLMNLCVNARDAMPNGGMLALEAGNFLVDQAFSTMHLDAKPGPHILLRVSDTGTGVPEGIRNKIFDPFFSTKPLESGTGLGLSTVRSIVKGHGGFISVYSEPNKGTEFRVYLPAQESAATTVAEVEQSALPTGKGELVLVVDDEAAILDITKQTLSMFGYEVLVARDGAEAIMLFVQHRDRIKLVLTDMNMPIMDGPATVRAIRLIDPKTKIIVASGLFSGGKTSDPRELEVDEYLQKPYTADKLVKTVHAVLEEKHRV